MLVFKARGVDSLGGVVYHVRPKFATPILHVINNFKNYEFFSTYTESLIVSFEYFFEIFSHLHIF
jgi:hypothetical protein